MSVDDAECKVGAQASSSTGYLWYVQITYEMGDDGDMDGDDGMSVEPPDTGSAGVAAAPFSSHALTLGLGALAVAMLAGARSATGRSR